MTVDLKVVAQSMEDGKLLIVRDQSGREVPPDTLSAVIAALRSYAAPEAARTVWQVANKTSSNLFATEDDAKRYVSSFSASVGGGMFITERDVFRVPLPQGETPE